MANGKRGGFLSKAREAEDQAARATSPKVKATWLKIAEGYRDLAEHAINGKP